MEEKNIIRIKPGEMELKPAMHNVIIGNIYIILLWCFILFIEVITTFLQTTIIDILAIIMGIVLLLYNIWSIKIEDGDSIIVKRFFREKKIYIDDLIDVMYESNKRIRIIYIENNKERKMRLPTCSYGSYLFRVQYINKEKIYEFLDCFEKNHITIEEYELKEQIEKKKSGYTKDSGIFEKIEKIGIAILIIICVFGMIWYIYNYIAMINKMMIL